MFIFHILAGNWKVFLGMQWGYDTTGTTIALSLFTHLNTPHTRLGNTDRRINTDGKIGGSERPHHLPCTHRRIGS